MLDFIYRIIVKAGIAVVVITAIVICFVDRQLGLFDEPPTLIEGFKRAVCLADGIVFGTTLSLLGLRKAASFGRPRIGEVVNELKQYLHFYKWYSLIVGVTISVLDWPAVTPLQIFIYLFVAITTRNISSGRSFYSEPDSNSIE